MRVQLDADETAVGTYEIAPEEDPSVILVAERVNALAQEELGREVDIQLVNNPRSGETLVKEFAVDTTKARNRLGWEPHHTVDTSVRERLRRRADVSEHKSESMGFPGEYGRRSLWNPSPLA